VSCLEGRPSEVGLTVVPQVRYAVALSKENEEAMRSKRSAQVHKAMRADYVAFCARVGGDPSVVTSSTAAQAASFYKYRTKNFRFGLSMAKYVSAQLKLSFKELGCSGQWSTGKVGSRTRMSMATRTTAMTSPSVSVPIRPRSQRKAVSLF